MSIKGKNFLCQDSLCSVDWSSNIFFVYLQKKVKEILKQLVSKINNILSVNTLLTIVKKFNDFFFVVVRLFHKQKTRIEQKFQLLIEVYLLNFF